MSNYSKNPVNSKEIGCADLHLNRKQDGGVQDDIDQDREVSGTDCENHDKQSKKTSSWFLLTAIIKTIMRCFKSVFHRDSASVTDELNASIVMREALNPNSNLLLFQHKRRRALLDWKDAFSDSQKISSEEYLKACMVTFLEDSADPRNREDLFKALDRFTPKARERISTPKWWPAQLSAQDLSKRLGFAC